MKKEMKLLNDQEIYNETMKRFKSVETMIDNEYSSLDETDTLKEAIEEIYLRLRELRVYLKRTNVEYQIHHKVKEESQSEHEEWKENDDARRFRESESDNNRPY